MFYSTDRPAASAYQRAAHSLVRSADPKLATLNSRLNTICTADNSNRWFLSILLDVSGVCSRSYVLASPMASTATPFFPIPVRLIYALISVDIVLFLFPIYHPMHRFPPKTSRNCYSHMGILHTSCLGGCGLRRTTKGNCASNVFCVLCAAAVVDVPMVSVVMELQHPVS